MLLLRLAPPQLRSGLRCLPQLRSGLWRRPLHSASSAREVLGDVRLSVGQTIHGFRVDDVQPVPELKLVAVGLTHEQTRAQYLHLHRDDANNTFSINFRTTPMNSSGLPHILEHTVLCGSKLFPVRDPFFRILSRSLATFMNAMTGADYTFYPFSTMNETDFRNLQKVYLDAVFRPNLREVDFMQEGWRLENSDLNDPSSELTLKGVVYNEMKGVFSENSSIYEEKMQNALLPDHTYGYVSGGDPLVIPQLTWEDLKEFHRKHYHPSNARFYSYGSFPLEPTLEYLNEEYLKGYEAQSSEHTAVPAQQRWPEPRSAHVWGRFESMKEPIEKQNCVGISYLATDVTDAYRTFLLEFVSELLVKGPNSPFYRALIEPNIGGGYVYGSGFARQTRDTYFTIGLQGLEKEHFGAVLDLCNRTIEDVIQKGFAKDHVDSVLHSYELSIKHQTTHFGLALLYMISPAWNHTQDIIPFLQVNSHIERLNQEMQKDPNYLQDVVREHLKDNSHRLVLTMSPDEAYEKDFEDAEKAVLAQKVQGLTSDSRKRIFEMGLELAKEQEAVQDAGVLPTLKIEDIRNDVDRTRLQKVKLAGVSTQICEVATNGITYFRGLLNTSSLSPEQQMLLPLFSYVITKLGTASMNHRDFDKLVNLKTGGLSLSVHIGESLHRLHTYEAGLQLSSYCLDRNTEEMLHLWAEVFHNRKLDDVKQLETLVKLYMTDLTQGIVHSGHVFAMNSSAGLVSGVSLQKDMLDGLQHITYMKRLVKTANFEAILHEVRNIAEILFDRSNMRCALNVSPESKPQAVNSLKDFISTLPNSPAEPGNPSNPSSSGSSNYVTAKVFTSDEMVQCQQYVLNIPVYYCSKSILTVPYADEDFARLRVLSQLLTTKYLHPELREKQGAYGGGARMTADGVLTFYSYRDPRHLKTLDVFDAAYRWAMEEVHGLSGQDVLEAKLGVFKAVDAPIAPVNRGSSEFLRGLTDDMLQRHRAQLMGVDLKALQEVAEKYLDDTRNVSGKVVLGHKCNEDELGARRRELWTVVDKE